MLTIVFAAVQRVGPRNSSGERSSYMKTIALMALAILIGILSLTVQPAKAAYEPSNSCAFCFDGAYRCLFCFDEMWLPEPQ